MDTFDDLLRFLNSVRNINYGGCAISALVMYRWLKKKKEKSKIVYCYQDKVSARENSKIKRKKIGQPCSCSHAILKYKNKYFDSNGIFNQTHRYSKKHVLPEAIVVRTINEAPTWNPEFNRDRIPLIMKKTNVDLTDILN